MSEQQQVQQQSELLPNGKQLDTQPQQAENDKLLTFTQAQMSALMSREKHEGKDSVYRALGIDPKDKASIEQAKAKLTVQQPLQENTTQPVSDKQEQAKQQEQPDPPQQAPQPQVNAVLTAEAKIALLSAGVQPELLNDALTLVLHKAEKSEQVQTEIDALKAKHSALFAPQKQTTGQLIGGLGTGAQQSNTAAEFGKQLAQQRNAGRAKQQQFFGGGNK